MRRCLIASVWVTGLTACGDAPGGRGFEVHDSAGVVVARNLAAPSDTLRLSEPELRIGVADGPPGYVFAWLSDVQPLPGGEIVVVDNRAPRVARFDSTGRWIGDIGRRGEGPGEYQTPVTAWLANGELLVWDIIPRRLSRFWPRGEFLGSENLHWKRSPEPLHRLGGGWVEAVEWGHYMEPGPARGALVRVDGSGEVRDTIVGPYPVPRIGWEIMDATGYGRMVNPPVFSAMPSWAVAGDRLYWSPGSIGRVEVRNAEDRLRRVVTVYRGATAVTDRDREAYLSSVQRRFGFGDEDRSRMRADTEFASQRPAITGLLVDDTGWLWVADHDPGALAREPGPEWDVLDPEGRVRRRVHFPAGFRLLRVVEGRAYGIATIDDGVPVVDVFSLGDRPPPSPAGAS
jgi:hypothetical protein